MKKQKQRKTSLCWLIEWFEIMTVQEIIKQVIKIIRRHLGAETKIYLFGSQAKGNAKEVSDIDIALEIKRKDKEIFYQIRSEIETIPTLRKIDIINLAWTTRKFKNHIRKHAVAL